MAFAALAERDAPVAVLVVLAGVARSAAIAPVSASVRALWEGIARDEDQLEAGLLAARGACNELLSHRS